MSVGPERTRPRQLSAQEDADGSFTFESLGLEPLSATEERELLAYHEAGHAVMAFVLGRPVTLVSLVPTTSWDGVCFHRAGRVRLDCDLTVPLLMLPWRLRGTVEKEIAISLTGPLAEALFRRRPSGYYGESEDERVGRGLAEAVTLTRRERDLLSSGDVEPSESDLETSTRLSLISEVRAAGGSTEEHPDALGRLQFAYRRQGASPSGRRWSSR